MAVGSGDIPGRMANFSEAWWQEAPRSCWLSAGCADLQVLVQIVWQCKDGELKASDPGRQLHPALILALPYPALSGVYGACCAGRNPVFLQQSACENLRSINVLRKSAAVVSATELLLKRFESARTADALPARLAVPHERRASHSWQRP